MLYPNPNHNGDPRLLQHCYQNMQCWEFKKVKIWGNPAAVLKAHKKNGKVSLPTFSRLTAVFWSHQQPGSNTYWEAGEEIEKHGAGKGAVAFSQELRQCLLVYCSHSLHIQAASAWNLWGKSKRKKFPLKHKNQSLLNEAIYFYQCTDFSSS